MCQVFDIKNFIKRYLSEGRYFKHSHPVIVLL